jgi:hypothetical protein
MGSVTTLWTFPETQSAVVAMTNGRDFGDASDFTAQILTQALFNLTPRVDFLSWVKMEAELAGKFFKENLLQPWERNRRVHDNKRDPMVFVGEYRGFDSLFALTVIADPAQRDSEVRLSVFFNNHKTSVCQLLFFQTDIYSFLPQDRNSWVSNYMPLGDYRQTLLEFEFSDVVKKATGIWWRWDMDEKPIFLRRTSPAQTTINYIYDRNQSL